MWRKTKEGGNMKNFQVDLKKEYNLKGGILTTYAVDFPWDSRFSGIGVTGLHPPGGHDRYRLSCRFAGNDLRFFRGHFLRSAGAKQHDRRHQ